MKNKSKVTAAIKFRQGVLVNWGISPQFNYQQQHQQYQVIRYWLTALNEIPVNYLIYNYLQHILKQKKYSLFLKYQYLKKNILKKKKKLFLQLKWKKKKLKNFGIKPMKFWRPKYLLSNQMGKIDFKWYKTGLHLNIPIFFLPLKNRINVRKVNKKKQAKKKIFIKKSKLQVLKLYFMKLILERQFKKFFTFPVILNFRNLSFTSKQELRVQTNQMVVFKDFFFFQRDRLFRRSIGAFAFGFYYAQSQLIAQQIAMRLTRTRKHMRTLNQLKQTLHYLRLLSPETSGYQIDIYGKIGAKTRTKFFRMTSGKLPKLQTLANRIHYTYQECYSFTGVFGIHVWLRASL